MGPPVSGPHAVEWNAHDELCTNCFRADVACV